MYTNRCENWYLKFYVADNLKRRLQKHYSNCSATVWIESSKCLIRSNEVSWVILSAFELHTSKLVYKKYIYELKKAHGAQKGSSELKKLFATKMTLVKFLGVIKAFNILKKIRSLLMLKFFQSKFYLFLFIWWNQILELRCIREWILSTC